MTVSKLILRRLRHLLACLSLFAFPTAPSAGGTPSTTVPRPLAFLHVNVVPMDSDRLLRDYTVVVSGGRIQAIGPSSTTRVPAGARRVDASGRYLAPGLADMHCHLYVTEELSLYVLNGVTTVFNLDGRPQHLGWRKRVSSGELLGPTIYTAGKMFNQARSPEEAVRLVDVQSAAGYDAIKIYNQVSAAEYPALTAEARRKNLILVGHIPREPGLANTLKAGQSIAHAEEYVYTFFNTDPDPKNEVVHPLDTMKIPEAVAMTREAGVSVIPTLVAFHNIVRQVTALPAYLRNPDLAYLAPFLREQLEGDRNTYVRRIPAERFAGLAVSYEFQRQLVKALHAGGVPVLAGTDASWLGVPGFSLHEEVENFQDLGFTPYEALKSATVDAARLLKKEGDFGTIAVGQRADMVLIRKNPLEDVRHLRGIEGVVANGRWIPDSDRRRLLGALPATQRNTVTRLVRQADEDVPALDRYLESNDPGGLLSAGLLHRLASERGAQGLVDALGRMGKTEPPSPLVAEDTLNELGYDMLRSSQTETALKVLRLNTELYPGSANAYDSLGEAYLSVGDKEEARKCYEKALEVQPDYPNAGAAREILETQQ